jgi:lysophospholipase
MSTTPETGFLQRPDGTRLFWRFARPDASPKALVVISHGLAEHSGRYEHVMARLLAGGYAALSVDHRGHGQSSGKRVFVQRFSEYSDDLQAIVAMGTAKLASASSTPVKVALLGHSMGGLICIQHLLDHPGAVQAAVLTGPGLGVAVAVPKWKDALGRVMSKVWPSLAIPTGISASLVSRDPAVVKAYETDPMVTKNATARWYTEFLDAQTNALAHAQAIRLPVLHMLGGKDGLVSVPAQEVWFKGLGSPDKTLLPYPELFHEILNEPEKNVVMDDLVRWLDARLA